MDLAALYPSNAFLPLDNEKLQKMLVKLLKWLTLVFTTLFFAGAIAGYLIVTRLSDELPDNFSLLMV